MAPHHLGPNAAGWSPKATTNVFVSRLAAIWFEGGIYCVATQYGLSKKGAQRAPTFPYISHQAEMRCCHGPSMTLVGPTGDGLATNSGRALTVVIGTHGVGQVPRSERCKTALLLRILNCEPLACYGHFGFLAWRSGATCRGQGSPTRLCGP